MTLAELLTGPRYTLAVHLDGVPTQPLARRHYTAESARRRADRLQTEPRNAGITFDVLEDGPR